MDSMNEVEKKITEIVDYAMDADFGGEGAMKMIGFNRRDYIVAELASLIQEERQGAVEDCMLVIKNHFEGLIAVPNPGLTLEVILGKLRNLKSLEDREKAKS